MTTFSLPYSWSGVVCAQSVWIVAVLNVCGDAWQLQLGVKAVTTRAEAGPLSMRDYDYVEYVSNACNV